MGMVITAAPIPAAGPMALGAVQIRGLEIVQTIQNLNNEIPLIRGKPTVARVYVSTAGLTAGLSLRGDIALSQSPGAPARYVASTNAIVVPGGAAPALAAQRADAAASLNFVVPPEALRWPALSVRISRLYGSGGDVAFADSPGTTVPLRDGPVLHVRAVGLRYAWRKPDGTTIQVAPEAFHFDHLYSFLKRAYPIADVQWSQVVVQASPLFSPPFTNNPGPGQEDTVWLAKLNLAHNQLSALRAKDVDGGLDPRTHYYGLVSDASAGLFFRGAAKDIPQTPDPTVVAVGPTGDPAQYPSLRWDKSRSFGGWYGTHELSHTFGRFHPGFCRQDASDPTFPYPEGRIGDHAHGDMVGFDVGDPALSIAMRAMANDTSHDIMTYCDNQWVSSYSYLAVLDRLHLEDAQFAPAV